MGEVAQVEGLSAVGAGEWEVAAADGDVAKQARDRARDLEEVFALPVIPALVESGSSHARCFNRAGRRT